MKNYESIGPYLFGLIVAMVIGTLIGIEIGRKQIYRKAISAGVAEYVIINQERGTTEFQWKVKP